MKRSLPIRLTWLASVLATALALGPAKASEKVTIAASETAILVWLAEERDFFADEGLDVALERYQSGSYAADAVLTGEAQLSTTSESAFVSRSLNHPELRILAAISASETARLVGRRDRGVLTPSDLSGKTIGVTKRSTGEFFLGRYLALNGLTAEDVDIVNLKPAEIATALTKGEIDAGLTWDPFIYEAQVALGEQAIVLPEQEGQFFYFLLMARSDWVEANPKAVKAILRALLHAEEFALEEPTTAKHAIGDKFEYERSYLDHLWPLHNLHVSLPQDLLFLLEEQAHWRISQGLVERRAIPNYLNFVASRPLQDVRPSAIGIVK